MSIDQRCKCNTSSSRHHFSEVLKATSRDLQLQTQTKYRSNDKMSTFNLLPTFTLECYLGFIAAQKTKAVKSHITASSPSTADVSPPTPTRTEHEIRMCFPETTWHVYNIRFSPLTPTPITFASIPPPSETLSVQAAWIFTEQLETVDLDQVFTEDERCNLCYGEFAHRDCCQKPTKAPCGHLFGKQCLVEALLEDRTTCPKCSQSLLARVKGEDICEDTSEGTYEGRSVLRTCDELQHSMLYIVLCIWSER